jgi:hypothetical protein
VTLRDTYLEQPVRQGQAEVFQGSSMARAPAQAGDAGSSPAPEANLTEAMCWATPRLIEVIDPIERAAIQAFWRPKIAVAATPARVLNIGMEHE